MTRTDIANDRRAIAAARRSAADVDGGVVGLYAFASKALGRWPKALDELERLRAGIDAARTLLGKRRDMDALNVLDCTVALPGYEPPTEKAIDEGWVP